MRVWGLVFVCLYLQGCVCEPIVLGYPSTKIEAIDLASQNNSEFGFDSNNPLEKNCWNFTCTVTGKMANLPSDFYWTIRHNSDNKVYKRDCNNFHYQSGRNICNLTLFYVNYYDHYLFGCHFKNKTVQMFTVSSQGYEIKEPTGEVSYFRPTMSILGTERIEYSPQDNLKLRCIVIAALGPTSDLTLKWIRFDLMKGKPQDLNTSSETVKDKTKEILLNYTVSTEDDGVLLICVCTHSLYERYGQKVLQLKLKKSQKSIATEQKTTDEFTSHEEDTTGSESKITSKDSKEGSVSWKSFLVPGFVVGVVLAAGAAAAYAFRSRSNKQQRPDPQELEDQRVVDMYALPVKSDRRTTDTTTTSARRSITDSMSSLEETQINDIYVGSKYDYVDNINS